MVSRIRGLWSRWHRARPVLLLLALFLVPILGSTLIEGSAAWVAGKLGVTSFVALLLFLLIVLAIALVSFLLFAPRGKGAVPQPKPFERLVRLDQPLVEAVQKELIHVCFPGVYPDESEIYAMYRKNPAMGVALRSREEDALVGFACAWPLKVEAAKRVIAGRMTENDLRADDLLKEAENGRAKYLLIPVVIVRDAETPAGVAQYWQLTDAFKDLICSVYLRDDRRRVTLIATGYSEPGRFLCRQWEMQPGATVNMDGKQVAIYTREVGRADLRR